YIIYKFNEIMKDLVVNEDNINKNLNLTHGLIFSQTVLLRLIDKRMKREQAYKIVQDVAMKCWREKKSFEKLLREDKEIKKYIDENDCKEIFDFSKSKKNVDFIFKTVGL